MTGKELRIVFMGTPDFAVASLECLVVKGYNVAGVVTAPDKQAGRGQKLTESAVKKYALKENIAVLQPEKLKDPGFVEELRSFNADLQIVVAFRMLPDIIWKMPRLGTFNLHASLLPQYRGAAPLNWAVINGETKTGVTTFMIEHKIDTGKILLQRECEIGEYDTVGDIHNRMMKIGADLVIDTVEGIAGGSLKPVDQSELYDPNIIRPAPKIFKEDCKIDWTADSEKVRNLIRGLSPHPAAWANLVNTETERTITCKIYLALPVISVETAPPGTIDSDGESYLNVACSNGWLEIKDIQLSGKKRMGTADFLRGFRKISEYRFE
jgi:methionyl-tRNA formyltransferase